ncbi:hypothetical protein BDW22DRAFT_838107 [Trametopsis cervina]|nr:hypothetical protein BDW22DRAFT_838107 [Trametopsis cervina]
MAGNETSRVPRSSQLSFGRPVDRTKLISDLSFNILRVLTSDDVQDPFRLKPCPKAISDLDVSAVDWKNLIQDLYETWKRGGQIRTDLDGPLRKWNDAFFSQRGVELWSAHFSRIQSSIDGSYTNENKGDDEAGLTLRPEEDVDFFGIYLRPLQRNRTFERQLSQASSSTALSLNIQPPTPSSEMMK